MIRAVFPGTFDPIHYGHIDITRRAARLFDELVVAVYDRPLKNLLFAPDLRISMTREAFKDDEKITVMGYTGLTVDFCRTIQAQVIVRGLRVFSDFDYEFRIALTNHHLAPEIEVIALITSEQHTFLSSTTVREVASLGGDISGMVPSHVERELKARFHEMGEESKQNYPQSSLRD
jgi:pantetheine-phosphate adenylyltransferase